MAEIEPFKKMKQKGEAISIISWYLRNNAWMPAHDVEINTTKTFLKVEKKNMEY